MPENVQGIVADDNFVPIEMTYENYKACVSEKRLFVVPGAEHGISYLVDTHEYCSIASDFMDKVLKNNSPT